MHKPVIAFLKRQMRDLREGGWRALRGKTGKGLKLLLVLLAAPITLPIVLVVRALRPWIVIRFGQLETITLGTLATNTELYLCERDDGRQGSRTLDIFHHYMQPVANRQLMKMFARTMHISQLAGPVDLLSRWLPGGRRHVVQLPSDRDTHGLLARIPSHLIFTPQEEHLGQEALRAMGVPEQSPFACFFARDAAYATAVLPSYARGGWDHHTYRDCDIHNYIPAAEELTQRGYLAIRLGLMVKEALSTTNPKIIDYATNGCRTDFLDIYLPSKCRFGIYTASGACSIPMIFRRPVAYVNCIPIATGTPYWGPQDLIIFKKLWLIQERRFMTFREMIDVNDCHRSEILRRMGIEVIENTPAEITDLAIEMDERLRGRWQTSDEDEDLQKRFRSTFTEAECLKWHGTIVARVGARFLRQNRELLDND